MQSFMDAGPPPLSPSSFFNFDGAGSEMSNQLDDGVDLFRYYMDMQAFQAKDGNNGAGLGSMMNNTMDMSNIDNNTNNTLSPYNNAFFNPDAYSRSSPSALSSSSSSSSTSVNQEQRSSAASSSSSNTLFPFAEASSLSTLSSYDATATTTVNPSSLLSFDHLAGSENPQPIDPHLLMGSNNIPSTSFPTQSILLPTVKEEEEDVDNNSPRFPLNSTTAFPLTSSSSSTIHPSSNATSTSHQQQQSRRSASAISHHVDESMNGIDGVSDDDDQEGSEQDDDDSEEEEEQVATTRPRKRGAATTAPSSKKRASSTKSSSKKTSTSTRQQSKKETSIFSSSHVTHPHALVPVPEYEDRPSKAEYDKLSSKEKRQMRNKISARNFRHRRKAHIDTLEALVQDKENVIAVLSEEVGTLRTENQGLRADIEVLKKNWESIAAKIGAAASVSAQAPLTHSSSSSHHPHHNHHHHHHLSPDEDDLYGAPGSLPALSPAASSSAESTNGDHLSELSFEQQARGLAQQTQGQAQASQARPSTSASSTASSSSNGNNKGRVTRSSIQRPNLRKDLGPSGASFSAGFGGVGNRSMNVHTTLIPELNFNFPVPPPSLFSSSPPTLAVPPPPPSSTNGSSAGRTSPSSPSSTTGSIGELLAGKRERDANASSYNSSNARLNMNPALNGLTPDQIANLREQFFNANSTMLPPSSSSSSSVQEDNAASLVSGKVSRHTNGNAATLDPLQNSFFDSNPFISLRQDSLQDYRAQLYAKLANNVAGIHQAQSLQSSNNNKNPTSSSENGMNGLRPAFFAQSLPVNNGNVNEKDAEVVKIASIAQKTLFDKLSTAFWDAFAGNNTVPNKGMIPSSSIERKRRSSTSSSSSSSSSSGINSNEVDGQKVADLLAGRSKLQIVKVNDQEEKEDKVDSLTRQVENMGLKK